MNSLIIVLSAFGAHSGPRSHSVNLEECFVTIRPSCAIVHRHFSVEGLREVGVGTRSARLVSDVALAYLMMLHVTDLEFDQQ